ncbi:hypothetical protein UA42_14555 [Photobacterium kishitanii]|nr:hypothetical protein UA42_14555 [Photobacterium kishitanii]
MTHRCDDSYMSAIDILPLKGQKKNAQLTGFSKLRALLEIMLWWQCTLSADLRANKIIKQISLLILI